MNYLLLLLFDLLFRTKMVYTAHTSRISNLKCENPLKISNHFITDWWEFDRYSVTFGLFFSSCLCLLCSLNELLILSLMFFIERKYISTFHPALKVKCILFVCCTGFVHIKNWVWFCWTVEVWWILMIHLGVWFVFMKSTFVKYKVVFSSFPLLFLFVCFSFVLF